MKIKLFPARYSNQPRIEAVTNIINANVDELFKMKLEVDNFFEYSRIDIVINGDTSAQRVTEADPYFYVSNGEMMKSTLTIQIRYVKPESAVTSNILTFRIGLNVGEQTDKVTVTEITNFPETGTKISVDETFKVNANIYICKRLTNVPSEITTEWLNDNFHVNLATGEQVLLQDYNDLSNQPKIGNKTVSGIRTIDYYGGYIKPTTGIPKTDLNNSINQSIQDAQDSATSANQLSMTANQTATSANSTANQVANQVVDINQTITTLNQQIDNINTIINNLGDSIAPDVKGNLPISKLPEIAPNTVLANNTIDTSQAKPVSITSLPVGVIPDKHIVIAMLSTTLQEAIDKANSSIQSLPTASTTVAGITQLDVTSGAAAYTSLVELRQALEELADEVETIIDNGSDKPVGGWTFTDLSQGVQDVLDLASTALQTLPEATSVNKGIVLLGTPGGAARYEDVGSGSSEGKMDKLLDPEGNMLVISTIDGDVDESPISLIELEENIGTINTLTSNDTVVGSVDYKVKQETDRAILVEEDLQTQIDNIDTGGGSGGTTNHAQLSNLTYETSGHTGFASATDITNLQGQINSIPAVNFPDPTNHPNKILAVDSSGEWVFIDKPTGGGGGQGVISTAIPTVVQAQVNDDNNKETVTISDSVNIQID